MRLRRAGEDRQHDGRAQRLVHLPPAQVGRAHPRLLQQGLRRAPAAPAVPAQQFSTPKLSSTFSAACCACFALQLEAHQASPSSMARPQAHPCCTCRRSLQLSAETSHASSDWGVSSSACLLDGLLRSTWCPTPQQKAASGAAGTGAVINQAPSLGSNSRYLAPHICRPR